MCEYGDNQRRVSFGGHVSGSIDGIILGGVPEAPKTPHIFKKHNKKSFEALVKSGKIEARTLATNAMLHEVH